MSIENLLINRIAFKISSKELLRKRENYLKLKKEQGLTEEDRLSPCDSKCDISLVDKIDILYKDIKLDQNGEKYYYLKQLVTYIDSSKRTFEVETHMLSIDGSNKVKKMVL